MAVTITHATVAVGTDAGNGEIRKAQWNENHTVTNAADITAANTFTGSGGISITGTGTIGYGAGSGGSVTQATSKTTGVTLNAVSGRVTMNAAALASAAVANFVITNSFMGIDDFVMVILQGGASNSNNYRIEADSKSGGAIGIRVTNISGSSKSEAVVLDFCIFKGANT